MISFSVESFCLFPFLLLPQSYLVNSHMPGSFLTLQKNLAHDELNSFLAHRNPSGTMSVPLKPKAGIVNLHLTDVLCKTKGEKCL